MSSQWISVNFHNFIDALAIAIDHGERIRASDESAFLQFCAEESVDLALMNRFARSLDEPKVGIIARGLMRGLFVYSVATETCFIHVSTKDEVEATELRETSGEEYLYDLAISYARQQRELVLTIRRAFDQLGLRVFWIDVDENPADPIWQVRFREGLFFSRYIALLVDDDYLKGIGATWEVFDASRLMLGRRRETFFYPLFLLTQEEQRLSQLDWDEKINANPKLREHASDAFVWIRDHVYPLNVQSPQLPKFFSSLARNDRGDANFEFLHCISERITGLQLDTFDRQAIVDSGLDVRGADLAPDGSFRSATVFLSHPWHSHYSLVLTPSGVAKYVGVNEVGPNTFDASAFDDPASAIVDHLVGRDVSRATPTAQHTSCGIVLPSLPPLVLGDESVDLQVNRDATLLLSRFGDRPVSLHSLVDGSLAFESATCVAAAMNSTGSVISVGTDRDVLLFDNDGNELRRIQGTDNRVTKIAWSHDDRRLAIGLFLSQGVNVVDPSSGSLTHEFSANQAFPSPAAVMRNLFALEFGPDSEGLLCGGMGGLTMIDLRTSQVQSVSDVCCYDIMLSPSANSFAAGFYDRTLRIYDWDSKQETNVFQIPGAVMQVVWLSECRLLARYRPQSNAPHEIVSVDVDEASIQKCDLLADGPITASRQADVLICSENARLEAMSLSSA